MSHLWWSLGPSCVNGPRSLSLLLQCVNECFSYLPIFGSVPCSMRTTLPSSSQMVNYGKVIKRAMFLASSIGEKVEMGPAALGRPDDKASLYIVVFQ